MDFPRLTLGVGINKHGATALAKRLGKFRSKLVARDNLGILASKLPGKQTADVPAEPVITPQWIPVTDDERLARFRGRH
jgi:hypothetical protein